MLETPEEARYSPRGRDVRPKVAVKIRGGRTISRKGSNDRGRRGEYGRDRARPVRESSETVRQTQRWDETVRSARQRAERGRNDRARLQHGGE
jgi:hypothetical protein